MKDTDLLNARLTKVQQDFDQQLLNCDQLATENTQKAAELKQKEDEINGLKQDTVRLTKMREAIQRKLRTIEDQKMEVEQQKETLKGQIAGLEKGTAVPVMLLRIAKSSRSPQFIANKRCGDSFSHWLCCSVIKLRISASVKNCKTKLE